MLVKYPSVFSLLKYCFLNKTHPGTGVKTNKIKKKKKYKLFESNSSLQLSIQLETINAGDINKQENKK